MQKQHSRNRGKSKRNISETGTERPVTHYTRD